MLLRTTQKVQLVTSAAAQVDVIVEWADFDNASTPPVQVDSDIMRITTAATTDIVPSPTTPYKRRVKHINIANTHPSTAQTVTLQVVDSVGPETAILDSFPLSAGERTAYREGVPMRVITATGIEKVTATLTSGAATTAQIAAHSADTYYLGMNVSGRLQIGSWFRWTFRSSKAAAGVATPTYIIRFGTAGTTADTARVTLTGLAQTALADNGYFVVEAGFRVIGASAVLTAHQSVTHAQANGGFTSAVATTGTSPTTQGTSATFDSSVANSIIGLSVNPGTSGAWVTDLVTLDAVNLIP